MNVADAAYIMVVDIGGGTSDVSILFTNGPMFATVALAGNNISLVVINCLLPYF